MSNFDLMNISKKNTNSYLPTILCTLLVLFLFAFASAEKKEDTNIPRASFHPFIEISYNSQAVIPTSTDLPICASFSDENRVILDQSKHSSAPTDHFNNISFRTAQQKHLIIKPILSKVTRRLVFPNSDPNDFIAIG